MKYAASVDIGGTQTRVSLINEDGLILSKEAFTTFSDDPIQNLESIKTIIDAFEHPVVGVGMSVPGPLDLKEGIVLTPPNLPGWHNFHIKNESERIFGKPCFIENDANLAGLAEALKGAGQGLGVVQFLTISTGVGGGLVINGEIFQGAHGFAQEIANSILWKQGPQLGNLKPGSLESICSGTAIRQRALDAGLIAEHAGDVNDLALSGNELAQGIMDDAKEYLANMLASMIGILDPHVIVLSGGVAMKIDGFIEDVQARVKTKVYDVQIDNVNIKPAQLGDDNGLIGGALLAFEKTKESKWQ